MSNETEKPETQADEIQANEIQPDESQKIEQVKTLPQSEEESVQVDGEVADDQPSQEGDPKDLHKPREEPVQVDGEVADDQPSQEGDPKVTEPDAKAEGPLLQPTSTHPVRWVIVFLLAIVIFYHFGYLRGQSEEHMKNISKVPEIQTDLKAIETAVKNERAKQRAMTELQFQVFVSSLEKQLNQFKSELEYRQLWERFASGEDAGRCTKGVYSGQVSCTGGLRADLNEYLARLEARNVCASGEWTAVQSDAPTESAASEASAASVAQSAPQVEYKDGLVFKFCQRPEFESLDSAE